jgi:hypothetical protein
MTKLTVIYGEVKDALGRKREGWIIVENGHLGYPFASKEGAVKAAKAIAAIRGQSEGIVKIIEDKTLQDVLATPRS